jgi:choline dehydrogenase-like flavoprotein
MYVPHPRSRDYVTRAPSIYNHGCETVRTGPDEDAMALVDAACRVQGARDLFMVDASVLPAITRTKTIAIGKGICDDD